MKHEIKHTIVRLPRTPGVYLMKSARNTIIYVGKSVNLRSRVASYFSGKTALNFAKKIMVDAIVDIDWIETKNETEALILETNLIKKHKPKFNVLMKDDKNLAYIRVTNDPVPEVVKTRRKTGGGAYFGPYAAGVSVTEALSALRKAFRIRACRMKFAKNEAGDLAVTAKAGRSIPCLDYYIGLCPAPCTLEPEKLGEHADNIRRLKEFMRGNAPGVIRELQEKMQMHAKNKRFEEAAKLRDQITSLKNIGAKQVARGAVGENADAVIFLEKYSRAFACTVSVRDGNVVGVESSEIENPLAENADILFSSYLARRYVSSEFSKKLTLLLRMKTEDASLLTLLETHRIEIEYPTLGSKKDLLDFAYANALSFAYKQEMASLSAKTISRATMASILDTLGYATPKRGEILFECVDISHTSGRYTVASRSVIANGKTDPSRYRKYHIRSLADGAIDDFASIKEVLHRRTLEGLEQEKFPTLILIDGGKGQLSHAMEGIQTACRERAISPKDVRLPHLASIAKREEEIFLPWQSESFIFDRGRQELMLLQKLRDEAHRFAIDFGRKTRSKAMKKNLLEELPGFGPATRKKLLSTLGSIEAIATTDGTTLKKILSRRQIEILRDHGIIE